MQGFRSATGVLVLSTALLIGSAGGATAVADTGGSDSSSTSSSADSSGADSSGAESSSGDSSASLRDSDPTSHSEAGSTLSQDDDSAESLAAEAASDEAMAAEDAGESLAVVEQAVAASEVEEAVAASEVDALAAPEQIEDQSAAAALATATEPDVAEAAAPEPVVSAPINPEAWRLSKRRWWAMRGSNSREGGSVAAVSTELTSASDESLTAPVAVTSPYNTLTVQDMLAGELELASLVDPAPFTTMFRTLETVVVSLKDAAVAIPPVIWALPFSETPISDVVALLETVLVSVTQSATAVAQLPRNFVALLGVPTVGAYTAAAGEPSGHHLPPIMDARIAAVMPAGTPTLLGIAPRQAFDPGLASSGFATLGPTALAALAAPIQRGVPVSIPALAGEYESIFDRAFGALIVPLSLWALATGALPGLVGLLVVFGAGARVGYRQAKAGFALKVAGIARFAGPGPMGVVRSGSLITVHPKGVRGRSPRWSRLGDQAA